MSNLCAYICLIKVIIIIIRPWPESYVNSRMQTHLQPVEPGFESRPSYKPSSWCFAGRVIHGEYVYRPLDGR